MNNMDKIPRVSVIIPTFNRLNLLKEAVESVLNQSFSDYELIITDNGSGDGTHSWVRSLLKKEPRVIFNVNEMNLGMVGNWNKGIELAKGQFVSILMDDDLWKKTFLEETVRILEKHDDVGFCAVPLDPFPKNISRKRVTDDFYRIYKEDKEIEGLECIRKLLSGKWLVGLPSAVLVRKKIFDEFGWFDEVCLDKEMWLRACQKYKMYYLDKKLCRWRVQERNSFTSTLKLYGSYFRQLRTIDKIRGYTFDENDLGNVFLWSNKAHERLKKEVVKRKNELDRKEFQKLDELYDLSNKANSIHSISEIFRKLVNK